MGPGIPVGSAAKDGYECFDELIQRLRAAGFTDAAQRLDDKLHGTVWTTSSEQIGELGLEILAFQRSTSKASPRLQRSLKQCMAVVRKVWPDIK